MNITINLNDKVSCVLTKAGATAINQHRREINDRINEMVKKDAIKLPMVVPGPHEDQLWHLMKELRGALFNGGPQLIEGNLISIATS